MRDDGPTDDGDGPKVAGTGTRQRKEGPRRWRAGDGAGRMANLMPPRDRIRTVAWRVYEVRSQDREKLDAALAQDPVSRTSIQIRDAKHFGWERETTYAVLEGDEERLLLADKAVLAFGRVPKNAQAILERVRWEDEASASSLGHVMSHLPEPKFETSASERRQEIVRETRTVAQRAKAKTQAFFRRVRRRLGS